MTRRLAVPASLVAAVVVLLLAGRGELASPPASVDGFVAWADERGAVVAALALLRLLALGVAAWLALASVAVAAGRAGAAERALPLALRRAMTGAGIASVVALGGPAAGADPGSDDRLVLLPSDGEGTATMSVLPGEPATEPTVPTPPAPAPPAPAPAPAPAVPEEWTVAPGESFWSIAEDVVSGALGRPATDAEIDPYWRTLIEANRDRLVSANPDLIHPGQVFILPAT